MVLSEQHRLDARNWIALSHVAGLGNVGLCALLQQFGTPEAILSASISQLRTLVDADVARNIQTALTQENLIQPTLDWLIGEQNHLITLADEIYPPRLLEISNPPTVLYAKGNLDCLNMPAVGIVGSRHATPQGEKNAESFAEDLCRHGVCVVSGMALGIDGAAHRGALKANGATIAVVGTGLDIVYPAKHRDLAHQIAQNGLILSEFALGTPSMARNFPRRNRIISGLSLGCLVVEANLDSGSLITARLAAEQGRDVFAIPGSIHSPTAKGCHLLIKQGAKLVDCTQDILDELKIDLKIQQNQLLNGFKMAKTISPNGLLPQMANTSPEAAQLLGLMGVEALHFDEIQTRSALTSQALSAMLMVMELEGKIAKLTTGQYQQLI